MYREKSARRAKRAAEATGDAGQKSNAELPPHLAGETQRRDLSFRQITAESDGMIAKGMSGVAPATRLVVSAKTALLCLALLKRCRISSS